MKTVALVPMKGTSERVPNKNLQVFDGKPLCEWILQTLSDVDEIDGIYVNTDSSKIADVAKAVSGKVQVIDRPEELRGNYVSMNKILEYDIEQVDADVYIQTHSTNPLLSSETTAQALNVFREKAENGEYDSLFSVTGFQTRFYNEDGSPVNHNPNELLPTQHLPVLFEENSNLYIFTKESFRQTNRRIGERPSMFEMNRIEAIDIDHWTDFYLAEVIKKSGILNNCDKQ